MKHTPTQRIEAVEYDSRSAHIDEAYEMVVSSKFALSLAQEIDALEKSHAELLTALEEVDSYPLPARIHRNIAGAIANAQPVATMLREGRG